MLVLKIHQMKTHRSLFICTTVILYTVLHRVQYACISTHNKIVVHFILNMHHITSADNIFFHLHFTG